MIFRSGRRYSSCPWLLAAIATLLAAAACAPGSMSRTDNPFAPGIDRRGDAVNGVIVGNRLLRAGQHELALDAFTRAALDQGMTPEIITGLGTANLGLGRLGQAETLLRRAVAAAPDWPGAWNNLGVLLMERGEIPEATLTLRKAYALDNGQSDSIRDNLRLALAKSDASDMSASQNDDYNLVRRGSSDYLIRKTP